jgi:hypothetical protein
MPNIFKTHALSTASLATQSDLDAAVATATPNQVKFAGLILNIPFGKRGSTHTRSTAKGYGARWDGKEWTLPPAKYTPGKEPLEWFRTNGLIAGVKTREYADWIWDGRPVDIALEIPFEDRHIAKQHGAKWDAAYSRWYLPKSAVTQTAVDALNKAEAIAGEISNTAPSQILAQQPAPVSGSAVSTPRVVQGVPAATPTQPSGNVTSRSLLAVVAERFMRLGMTNLSATYGDTFSAMERLRAAESDSGFAARTKHWLSRHDAQGGVYLCFTEVPCGIDEGEAICIIAVEAGPDGSIASGPLAGHSINHFLTQPLSVAGSFSDSLQCVIRRKDAIRLYEDLANGNQFVPYQAA